MRNDIDEVRRLIESGVPVNSTNMVSVMCIGYTGTWECDLIAAVVLYNLHM